MNDARPRLRDLDTAAAEDSTSAGRRRHSERESTRLQAVFQRAATALDAIELLPGRERAVAIDLTRRRLQRTIDANEHILAEWDLRAA